MSWIYLVIAGVFEIFWAVGLKYTDGFTRLWPSIFTVLSMLISITLLGMAMKELPAGTAYATWSGIGAVGTIIAGIILFNEPATIARLFCLVLILAGVIGLKFIKT